MSQQPRGAVAALRALSSLVLLVLLCAADGSSAATHGADPDPPQHQRPHILLVVLDDIGHADTTVYREDANIPTPHLRALADDSVRLTNHYTQTVCSPTRSALMTGRFPFRFGMQHRTTQLPGMSAHVPLSERMLPEYLREAGYRTEMIGKWHCGYASWAYTPTGRGFDNHYGYLQAQIDYYNKTLGIGDFTSTYLATEGGATANVKAIAELSRALKAAEAANLAAEGLAAGQQQQQQQQQQPLMGFDFWRNQVPLFGTSGYYSVPMYQHELRFVLRNYTTSHPHPAQRLRHPLFLYLAHQTVHIPIESKAREDRCAHLKEFEGRYLYCCMLVELDDAIGELVALYKSEGLWDDTLLVLTTDNGGMTAWARREDGFPRYPASAGSNLPLRGGKMTMFEGGVRGLGLVGGGSNAFPDHLRGRSWGALMHVVDMSALVLGRAGVITPRIAAKLDGIDPWDQVLAAFPKPGAGGPARMVGSVRDSVPINIILGGQQYTAVRFGNFKLIVDDTSTPGRGDGWFPEDGGDPEVPPAGEGFDKETPFFLYDLSEDPEERHNLVSTRELLQKNMSIVADGLSILRTYILDGYHEPQGSVLSFDVRALPSRFGGAWGPFLTHPKPPSYADDHGKTPKIVAAELDAFARKWGVSLSEEPEPGRTATVRGSAAVAGAVASVA